MGIVKDFKDELERLLEIEKLYRQLPLQEIGEELDLLLGMDIGQNILPYIRLLKKKNES